VPALESNWTSIIPPLLAVILAFITREAVFSLAVACLAGVVLMGPGLGEISSLLQEPAGWAALFLEHGIKAFCDLIVDSLGNRDFVWICMIELCIGVLVAFFQRSGAVGMFTARARVWATTRKKVSVLAWLLGLFIFFSDYFSPLFVGPIMRDLTDKFKISREKLAYICDSTSSPLVVMIPISGWAVYISGLMVEQADINDAEHALRIFIRSIPYNFYGFLAVGMVFLLAMGLIKDYGPMRRAEKRTMDTGKVMRDGAVPMMGDELTGLEVSKTGRTNIFLNFLLPVLIIIVVNTGTFIWYEKTLILESFMLAVIVLGIILWLQRVDDLRGIMKCVYSGTKGVLPAVMILALAYCINTVSKEMQTAQYVISITEEWLKPALLPVLLFIISGFISFATGTAWGTYAIMIPIALPMAYGFSGDYDALVLGSLSAVVGGGIFGDHCSPLSDTTVLSSLGSACDHIDHVKTQLPYTLTVAAVVSILYLIVGYVWSMGK
jgi:Na+/H+ antiporter NhaC